MTKVLIVSEARDVHAQVVMAALTERGDAAVELLDASEFPSRLSLTMVFDDGGHRFSLRRRGGNEGTFDLSEIGAVWWRRPQPYGVPTALSATEQRFIISESEMAFHGMYQSLNAFWINQPSRDIAASRKPWQLALAQEIGLEIPPTLMTSDPDAAQAFWQRNENAVVYKQFLALPDAWRETRRLTSADTQFADAIQISPVIFQRYVEAVAEIRAIVIGKDVFAASTDLEQAEYPADVRMNLTAQYEPNKLPVEIETRLSLLRARMGLEYGAVDLRLTPDGNYVFLELNPAGQFLYLGKETRERVVVALAAHLVQNAIN